MRAFQVSLLEFSCRWIRYNNFKKLSILLKSWNTFTVNIYIPFVKLQASEIIHRIAFQI